MAGAFQIARAMWSRDSTRWRRTFAPATGWSGAHQHPLSLRGHRAILPRRLRRATSSASWIPALEGVKAKLEAGAKVADVGCGLGASTILMAKAFPKSTLLRVRLPPGLDRARAQARQGSGRRAIVSSFEVATSTDYPGTGYDLVAHFDCLHDMEDPAAAAKHAKKTLAKDGTWMIVEPFASDKAEENHNPVGRVFYSASTMLCVPHSLAHQGPGLGAQAGEARLREVVVDKGGFSRFRRATQTPFNLVLEARP